MPVEKDLLVEELRLIAREYDSEHFFISVDELNRICKHQRRPTLKWLMDEKLLYLGEWRDGSYRYCRKVNRSVANRCFGGKRKRVYVIKWELLAHGDA